jgi:adenine-specific DNA-methyltransferase
VKSGFSIVIANPPYIREEDIKDQKPALKALAYEAYAPRADLYVYFYERASWLLAPGGVACYISSNKFMRAKYGENLRRLLSEQTTIDLIVDLGGQKVFESATVDTCIVKFNKQPPTKGHTVLGVPMGSDFTADTSLTAYVLARGTPIVQQKLGTESWTIANDAVLQLKEKIAAHGTPLKEWKVNISYGIKTGLNEAFVIDTPTKEKLCREDPRSAEIIKPVLRGRDIERWSYDWDGLYVILASYGSYTWLPKRYPAIYRHLLAYQEQLKKRGQCTYSRAGSEDDTRGYSGQHHWLELDNNPQESYLAEFEKPKVVWPMVSSGRCSFAQIPPNMYLNNKCFMITGDSTSWAIALLNSSLAWFWFSHRESQLGTAGIEIRTDAVWSFPVPKLVGGLQKQLAKLAHQITASSTTVDTTHKAMPEPDRAKNERAIDELVYAAYGLTADEVALVESSVGTSA